MPKHTLTSDNEPPGKVLKVDSDDEEPERTLKDVLKEDFRWAKKHAHLCGARDPVKPLYWGDLDLSDDGKDVFTLRTFLTAIDLEPNNDNRWVELREYIVETEFELDNSFTVGLLLRKYLTNKEMMKKHFHNKRAVYTALKHYYNTFDHALNEDGPDALDGWWEPVYKIGLLLNTTYYFDTDKLE